MRAALGLDSVRAVSGIPARVVAALTSVVLVSACTVTRKERTIATYASIGVGVGGVATYLIAGFKTCPPHIDMSVDQCEENRGDAKDIGGILAITGLVAAIAAQLLPVYDEEQPAPPPAPPAPTYTTTAPAETSAHAATLRDPAAVQLAENARKFAAEGRCMEAFGSLKALRQMDAALADQLQAWDPAVSKCKAADVGRNLPSGPPSQTAPTPSTAPATTP